MKSKGMTQKKRQEGNRSWVNTDTPGISICLLEPEGAIKEPSTVLKIAVK